jgi:hypothetical protein
VIVRALFCTKKDFALSSFNGSLRLCTSRRSIQQECAFLFGDGLSRQGAFFPARAVESVIDTQSRCTPLALGRTQRSQLAFGPATLNRADFRQNRGFRLSLLSVSLSRASAIQL